MKKLLRILISFPKIIYTNLKWLPLRQAVKLPILISYSTKLTGGGKILINGTVKPGMIHIGFHEVDVCNSSDSTIMRVNGDLVINGRFHIGRGSKIVIKKQAQLIIGDNFGISASSSIKCYNKIIIGKDVLLAWDVLVMDTDAHPIFGGKGQVINAGRSVIIGDHVWIGCRSTILKGSHIPDGCVVGACSTVTGSKFAPNTIIIGQPAKSTKKIERWEEHWPGFA